MPYPVLGSIPPDVYFGEGENNGHMNLMTADEKIKELQTIIDQRDQHYEPMGKENNQFEVISQLENKLQEVMQVNEKLVEEIHDNKYVTPGVKTKLEQEFTETESQLESKIADVMEKMGNGVQNVRLVQDIVGQSMAQFRDRISTDIENDLGLPQNRYSNSVKLSESSSEAGLTPRAIQSTYSSTFDYQFANSGKSRGYENDVSSSSNPASKPVNKKSTKHFHKPKTYKSTTSQKHLTPNGGKKTKANSKYLNFIDSGKRKQQEYF